MGDDMRTDQRDGEFDELLAEGRFLRFGIRDGWEYAARKGMSGIVGILAVTDDGKLILVEQFRPPVAANVIELPAGLIGDEEGVEGEGILDGAARELLEEAGYRADHWEILCSGPVSPGSMQEVLHLVLADGLTRVGPGGGVPGESLRLHEVPLDGIEEWLREREREGAMVDLKIYAGLHFRRRLCEGRG